MQTKSFVVVAVAGFALSSAAPPAHADQGQFRLPFPAGKAYPCTQSVGGALSHSGDIKNAYDFSMPAGTVIVAAMDGKVVRVVDDETQNGSGGRYGAKGNHIEIEHPDHTIGVYQHLQAGGAKVKQGQRVRQGDPLALSGNTGNSTGPHLHFHVWDNARTQSFPITFADVPDGGVPVKGKTYTSANVAGIPAPTKDAVEGALRDAEAAEQTGAPGVAAAFCRRAARLKLGVAYPLLDEAKKRLARLEALPAKRAKELEAQAKTEFDAAARDLLRLRLGCDSLDAAPLATLEKALKADKRFAAVKKAERSWAKVQKAFVAAWRHELKGKLKKAYAAYRSVAKKTKQAPDVAAQAAKRQALVAKRLQPKKLRR